MKTKAFVYALLMGLVLGCAPGKGEGQLPSWNDTPVKQELLHFINERIRQIPVEDRIAVFDMDGTLVCERPWGIETVVSIHRLMEMGEKDPVLRESIEYRYAEKLSADPRDTSVLNHCIVNGENILWNIIMKPFDGADCEEYIRFANRCLNTERNADYGLRYSDMFYRPMLELVEALKAEQFQIYVVSASMQGIVWSICPQELGLERSHLLGIRHVKKVEFPEEGPVTYTIRAEVVEPVNSYRGKAVNIYDHIGKIPVVAVGNAYSDFGMFHMVSRSPYPHLAMLLHHDDAAREYVYSPARGMNWQDSLRLNGWLQADMAREFKVIWKDGSTVSRRPC